MSRRCHFYYTLTDSGLQYVREFLHLPNAIVPNTYKRVNPTLPREDRPRFRRDGERRPYGRDGERRPYGRDGERRGFRNNRSGFRDQPKEQPAEQPKEL